MDAVLLTIVIASAPSILSGFVIYKITKIGKQSEKQEAMRKEECILILKNIDANGALAEQTARCAKGEKLNGNLDKALLHRDKVKKEMYEHLVNVNAEFQQM